MSDHKREVFISYHTSSAGDQVRKIAAALEGAGISCWYAPRDCGPQYAGSIVQAIRDCRVFLLLLNEQSNLSAHCLNEINCAFDRLRNREEITLLPFRLDQCTLSDDVFYYLGRIHIMDGTLPPEVLRVQELVDRVMTILGKEPERYAAVTEGKGETKTYSITGSIVYPDNQFIGRKAELAAIEKHLSDNENKLFLVGMGGIGKSEIAKMYLKQHMVEYDVVVWMVFEDSLMHTVASDSILPVKGLSRQDYPEDDERAYFERKLRILKEIGDRRVLFVVDNFDVTEMDPDLEAFCSGSYGVLFTTRYHQNCGNIPEVEVHPMVDEGELLNLFRTEYTRALDPKALEYVYAILKLLDGHTLSIRLVASAMQSRRIQPEKMLRMLIQGSEEMKKQNAKAADMIFGRLRQVFRLATLNEDEQYLLKNLSVLSMQGISVETLFDWCQLDDFDVIDELIRKSWVIHDPVMDEVHLHPLVSDLMEETVKKDDNCCVQLLEKLLEASQNSNNPYIYKLRLHSHACVAVTKISEESPAWILVAKAKAFLIKEMAQYLEAARLFCVLREKTADLDEKMLLYYHEAHCYNLNGDPATGRKIAEEAYTIIADIPNEQLTQPQGIQKVQLLSCLAEASRDLEDYSTSIKYARIALSLSEKYATGSPKSSVGWVEYHLAKTLLLSGQIGEAEEIIRHSLRMFLEADDTRSSAYSYDLLGQVLMHQGKFAEALSCSDKDREILVPINGEDHVDLGNNLFFRGNIYAAMGERDRANDCYRRAAEIYYKKNCYGKAKRIESNIIEMEE